MAQKNKEISEEERKAQEFVEKTAQGIIDLAEGVRALLKGKLTKKAVILLIASASGGMPQSTVTKVLDTIAELDKTFLNK